MTDLLPAVTVHRTACTLDCPDTCSLAVTITRDATGRGRITDIDAAPGTALTDGWICAKVKQHARRVYAPERVMTPLIRTGAKGAGEFREATWEEALGLVAHRMRGAIARSGPDAVVAFTYNSSAAVLERASFTEAFFAAVGATIAEHTITRSARPRWGPRGTACSAKWPPPIRARWCTASWWSSGAPTRR